MRGGGGGGGGGGGDNDIGRKDKQLWALLYYLFSKHMDDTRP